MTIVRNKLIQLLVISIIVRIIFSLIYPIKSFPDTSDYFKAAKLLSADSIEKSNLEKTTWPRPPGYPALIAAVNFNPQAVVIIQAGMGVGIAVLLYLMFLRITRSEIVSFVIGLSYGLNPSQLLFEFGLSSETTGTFFLILTLYCFFRILDKENKPKSAVFALPGLLISLSILTRSQFQIVLVLMFFFLAYQMRTNFKRGLLNLLIFLLPVIIIFGIPSGKKFNGLIGYEQQPIRGTLALSHLYPYLEDAPEEFGEIKDILIKHRDKYRKAGGPTLAFSVTTAIPELLEKTGSHAALSDTLGKMALSIIRKRPVEYSKTVSWYLVDFFRPTWYSRQFGIRSVLYGKRLSSKIIAASYAVFHLTSMSIFLFLPFIWIIYPRSREPLLLRSEVIFIYLLVFFTDLAQAIFTVGDPRYKTSVEPLIIGISLWIAALILFRMHVPGFRNLATGFGSSLKKMMAKLNVN